MLNRFILFAFFLIHFFGYTQTIPFVNIGIKQGLSQAYVFDIIQDSKGYIWMATENGANKYDGKNITIYDDVLGKSTAVQSMFQDKDNNLWFATKDGIVKYNHKTFTIFSKESGHLAVNGAKRNIQDSYGRIWFGSRKGISIYINDSTWMSVNKEGYKLNTETKYTSFKQDTLLQHIVVHDLKTDNKGNIWIATEGGLTKFNGQFNHKAKFTHYNISNSKLPQNNIKSICFDPKGALWIGTADSGLVQFNLDTTWTTYTVKNGLLSNKIRAIYIDSKGNLWIGQYRGGVSKLNGDKFTSYNTKNGLANDNVISIFEDKHHTMWFGTEGGGVSKLNKQIFQIMSTKDGLVSDNIRSITQDKEGNLWFGTFGGASKWDGITWENFTTEFKSPYIMTVYTDIDNRVWIGTFFGGLYKYENKKIVEVSPKDTILGAPLSIISIFQDSKKNYWFGDAIIGLIKHTPPSLWEYYDPLKTDSGLTSNTITCIFEDRENRLWFGTENGVCRFDPITKTWMNYINNPLLPKTPIRSILQDSKGRMWFGTDGEGMMLYDGKQKKIINKKSGLHSNTNWLMLIDNSDNIWVGHNKGIEKYDPFSEKFAHYGYREGFTPIEVNAGGGFKDNKGNLWFGTVEGAVMYSPAEDKPNPIPPIAHITEILLHNESVTDSVWKIYATDFDYYANLPIQLTLPHDKNYITFKYIGIQTDNPEQVKYQYMLEGFENSWQPFTSATEITYSNLDPGTYTFLLKAFSGDNITSNEPLSYTFTIAYPIWERWWFYLIEIGFFLLLFSLSLLLNQRNANPRVATVLIFISIIIVIEFGIMNIENWVDNFTGGIPIIKLIFNVLMAISFKPIEEFANKIITERKIKSRLTSNTARYKKIPKKEP